MKGYTDVRGVVTVVGDRIMVVPVGTQYTEDEATEFNLGGSVSISSGDEKSRQVLSEEQAVDVVEVLRKHEGRSVTVLVADYGPGLTRLESDRNLVRTRPNDPYVLWAGGWGLKDLPFVCPDGLVVHDRRFFAVVYGKTDEKLAKLDLECPCGRKPHRNVYRKNRLRPDELEDLITRILINGEEFRPTEKG